MKKAFQSCQINFFCPILMMVLCVGCKPPTDDHLPTVKKLDFTLAQTVDVETLLGTTILPLFNDTNVFIDQFWFGQVTDQYYLFNTVQNKIQVFDRDFHFIRNILEMGKGPGEVIMPSGLSKSTGDSEFYIVDPGNRKILRIDITGQMLEEIATDHWIKEANKISTQPALYVGSVNGSKTVETGKSYNLAFFNEAGDFIRGFFEFEEDGAFGMGTGRNLHRLSDEMLGYYLPYSDTVFHVDKNGPEPAYIFELPAPPLPSHLFMDYNLGKVGMDEYVTFLSYFEDGYHLLLTYDLGRDKYWSFLEKSSGEIFHYKLRFQEGCWDCSRIRTIALTQDGAIAVVQWETLLRLINRDKISESFPLESDMEYGHYLVKIPFWVTHAGCTPTPISIS